MGYFCIYDCPLREKTAGQYFAIIPYMGNNLKRLRLARGWTHDEAALHFGVSRGQYIKLERGERRLNSDYIRMAAQAFDVTEVDVIAERTAVPIMGFVGAGSEAHFYDGAQGPFDEVQSIAGANDKTVAVEIRGNCLGPVFDGWVAYYDDVRSPPTDDLIGELCVVGLTDGRVLIKKLYRHQGTALFDLWSNFEPPISNVALLWAAVVKAICPR
jgi:transcriptional regulator with XRE-family HTH domain